MNIEKLSDNWLYQRHSREELTRWVSSLKYAYYKRAWGGHANDGDDFFLTLTYQDRNDLKDILKKLNIRLTPLPKGDSVRPYSKDELSVIHQNEVADLPGYKQSGWTEVNGIRCYCRINKGEITFLLAGADGDPYEVTEADFENCKKLEQLIIDLKLTGKVNRDCERSVTCISKARYSELFDDQQK